MLSLQRSNPAGIMPWFARPHREHHQFLAATDESAVSTVSNTSTEEGVVIAGGRLNFPPNELKHHHHYSSHHKKLSESRPRSTKTRHSHEEFLDLPSDPRCWLREDVQTWIRHLAAVHGLPDVQADRFLMNGKALCLMTMEMFCQRVPLGGKMLYKDFQLRLSMAMYGDDNNC